MLIKTLIITNRYDLLQDKGSVSAEQAKQFAESEFEKFRIEQDKQYISDFDKIIDECKKENIEFQCFLFLEATPGFEPGIRVLQTRALPLGYIAI